MPFKVVEKFNSLDDLLESFSGAIEYTLKDRKMKYFLTVEGGSLPAWA